jgi:hypothetical protein
VDREPYKPEIHGPAVPYQSACARIRIDGHAATMHRAIGKAVDLWDGPSADDSPSPWWCKGTTRRKEGAGGPRHGSASRYLPKRNPRLRCGFLHKVPVMTDVVAPLQAPARRDRERPSTVTATQLGAHLALSRQHICTLADVDHVIERLPDGRFDQDACRIAYLKWLRDPSRRAARSEAAAAFVAVKTQMMELKLEERKRRLVPIEVYDEMIDTMAGVVLSALGGMAARIGGHDLQLRRRVEQIVYETRVAISEAATRMADAAEAGAGRT